MYMIDNTDMYIFHVAKHPRQTEPTPIDTIIDFVLIKLNAYTFSKSDPGFFDRGGGGGFKNVWGGSIFFKLPYPP